MSERFRFDDAYESVYEYNGQDAYIHVGSYLALGIEFSMSDAEKIARANGALCESEEVE